jgi:hypothetical protein
MKLRAAPAPTAADGCRYSGKTFHRWVLSFIDPRDGGCADLERKCCDCGIRQHAEAVPDEETRALPKVLWCLGDWPWHPGSIEP